MKRQQKWKPYLLISPYFLIYFVFSLFPILFSFVVSFHKWSGADDMEFVGLQNYTRLFTDGTFYLSLYNTFIIMLIVLPLQFFTAAELNQVEGSFTGSAFVKQITGTDNVCERGALLLASVDAEAGTPQNNGSALLLQPKTAMDGVTAALAMKKGSIRFE